MTAHSSTLSSCQVLEAARVFLELCARELHTERELPARWRAVVEEVTETGSYTHTPEELTHGARVAWRNHAQCIGRLTWRGLRVFDARQLERSSEIFAACQQHLRWSGNGGRIRPALTVFRPRVAGRGDLRIHNRQLISYAGFPNCGDPLHRELTAWAQSRGWPAQPSDFVPLPLCIGEEWFAWSDDDVLEVCLEHPDWAPFSSLNLRWYGLPAVCNLELEMGGVVYPAAPFSGYYMLTEVGSRDLGDRARYNRLPKIARCFGFDQEPLWQDRAVTELNRAVLYSFNRAGVSMVDHHTASEQFLRFCQHEQQAGREVSAQWSWIVPPAASSCTDVFFTPMRKRQLTPCFRPRSEELTSASPGQSENRPN